MVTKPSFDEVEAGYQGTPVSADNPDLDPQDADQLIDEAVSMYNNVFSDQILFTAEGLDEDNAVRYLARHKWAIALGDTVASESQGGGSVSYVVSSATARSLSKTHYGQELLEYLRSEPNIGVFRTR